MRIVKFAQLNYHALISSTDLECKHLNRKYFGFCLSCAKLKDEGFRVGVQPMVILTNWTDIAGVIVLPDIQFEATMA